MPDELRSDSESRISDSDRDGVANRQDNCQDTANANQSNLDMDEFGDACDPDADGDEMPDAWEMLYDLNPRFSDDAELDADDDGLSNVKEFFLGSNPIVPDIDFDGRLDGSDNCLFVQNSSQVDLDSDHIGDECDPDIDGDGFDNNEEIFNGSDPRNSAETYSQPYTIRISVGLENAPANGYSMAPSISSDGTLVAFASSASNLVESDQNAMIDIFVRNAETKNTLRASKTTEHQGGNSQSVSPIISDNGSIVAFNSTASNLTYHGTSGLQNVYVYNLEDDVVSLASSTSDGRHITDAPSYIADILPDGSALLLNSNSQTLTNDTARFQLNAFYKDLRSGDIRNLGTMLNPKASQLGTRIAFESPLKTMVANDNNRSRDIFFMDLDATSVSLASHSQTSPIGNNDSLNPDITPDGRYIVYETDADNLFPRDMNRARDILIYDTWEKKSALISKGWRDDQANGNSYGATVSNDGRFVSYSSDASNIVPYDYNHARDIFVHDRLLGKTVRASVSTSGAQADRESEQAVISASGRCVAFVSSAGNLDEVGDKKQREVFLRCRS